MLNPSPLAVLEDHRPGTRPHIEVDSPRAAAADTNKPSSHRLVDGDQALGDVNCTAKEMPTGESATHTPI